MALFSGRESRSLLRKVRDAGRVAAGAEGGAPPRVGLQPDDQASRPSRSTKSAAALLVVRLLLQR